MCSSWSHEALRDFYFFDLGKRIVIVIVFRARNIVWVIHLLLLSDLKKLLRAQFHPIAPFCSPPLSVGGKSLF